MSKEKLEGQNTTNNVLTKKGTKVFHRRNKVKVLIGASAGVAGIGAGIGIGYAVKPTAVTTPDPDPTPDIDPEPEPEIPVLPNNIQNIDLTDFEWEYQPSYEQDEPDYMVGVGYIEGTYAKLVIARYVENYDKGTGECLYTSPTFWYFYNSDETKCFNVFAGDVAFNYITYQWYLSIIGIDVYLLQKDLTNEERESLENQKIEMQKLISGEEAYLEGYKMQAYRLSDECFEQMQKDMHEAYKQVIN